MILCDVSVLVNACASKAPLHEFFHSEVEGLIRSERPFGIYGPILGAVLRICTHPKIFKPPASPETVFPFLESLRGHPRAVVLEPGGRHWTIFKDFILALELRGGDVTDAWFAALAVEHDCEWWTADSGFDRFPSLRIRNLLKPQV
jgi:hypothetical protein